MTLSLSVFRSPTTSRQEDLLDRLHNFLALLPDGNSFQETSWNIAAWSKRRPKIFTLDFAKIGNPDLIDLCKLNLLERRHLRQISTSAAQMTLGAFTALGQALQARNWQTLDRGDFIQAEKWLIKTYNANTAYRISSELSRVALWLRDVLEKPLSHTPSGHIIRAYGRGSAGDGSEQKLLPNDVISDFLSARLRSNLSKRDSFYLHVLALQVACGFRAHEMATLPVDCLIEDEDSLLIRNFSSKGGRSAPRPISPHLAPMVREAVLALTQMTQDGRKAAKHLAANPERDWGAICQDEDALTYFVSLIAHEWTRDPDKRLINPDGVWVGKQNRVVDVLALMNELGSMVKVGTALGVDRSSVKRFIEEQTSAQKGHLNPRRAKRASWDTDPRAFSVQALVKATGTTSFHKSPHKSVLDRIAQDTLAHQLRGDVYPKPPHNAALEQRYQKAIDPVLKDGSGIPVLMPHEALLVVCKNALSETLETQTTDIHVLTTADLNRWLSGELRSRGTGNHEDTAGARLNILDPRTETPAVFTWHDVRHWLNTAYEAGGMSQEQIAMMFNRKTTKQNSVYSHIPKEDRKVGIKALMDTGAVTGPLANAVGLLAEHNREDAEKYLAAMTRTHTPMPHGLCTLNWALETCPHHLSCFSCNTDETGQGKACEHLVVDTTNPDQIQEITRLRDTSQDLIALLKEREIEGSPAYAHHTKILQSTNTLLKGVKS